jgi:ribosome biogenesis GTPase
MTGAAERPPGERRAVVARVDFRSCLLLPAEGDPLEATVRGRLLGRTKTLGNALVVGDMARYDVEDGRAVVTGAEPRRNHFSRRAPGDPAREQVVAASLDQVVLVTSIVEPDFRPGFADRVLCQAEHAGLPARLVVNKVDLDDRGETRAVLEDYARAGYAGRAVSAKTGEGVEHLRRACRGRRSLFVGHSGVGKSTLLNALVPGLDLLVGRVNSKTGKGRHITTAAWLIRPEPEFELIDTPGMRTFALWGVGPRDLEQAYTEFRRFLGECRFANCRHDREPGCAIKAAVDVGEISSLRHDSFLKLLGELEPETAGA